MPARRVFKRPVLTILSCDQVFPIKPEPNFLIHTTHVHVIQGGFMDDSNVWHQAPKKVKEAVKLNGVWYWAFKIRDRKGKMMLSKSIMK